MGTLNHRVATVVVSLLALSLVFACQRVEQSKIELTQNQWTEIQNFLLDERPDPEFEIGVEFGDEIELIGADIDGDFEPGEVVEITWYWQALADVDDDWQIFVHFDSEEARFRQNLDHYPLGEQMSDIFRTYHWEEGHIIADIQRFTLRDDYPAGNALFYVGLFRGEERSPVSNDGEATGDDRAIGPTVQIAGEPPEATDSPAPSESPTPTEPSNSAPN